MSVHGDDLLTDLTEDAPLVTRGDPYGVSKAEGERLARELGTELGLEVVVLRPTLVYGPAAPRAVEHDVAARHRGRQGFGACDVALHPIGGPTGHRSGHAPADQSLRRHVAADQTVHHPRPDESVRARHQSAAEAHRHAAILP